MELRRLINSSSDRTGNQRIFEDSDFDLHVESLKRHGGATGLREPGLLDSALASAMNTVLYANGDKPGLAALLRQIFR